MECSQCGHQPFYLHTPANGNPTGTAGSDPPPISQDGLYINPMTAHQDSASSFYLHNPQDVIYNRVKEIFDCVVPSSASTGSVVSSSISNSTTPSGPLSTTTALSGAPPLPPPARISLNTNNQHQHNHIQVSNSVPPPPPPPHVTNNTLTNNIGPNPLKGK